MNTHSLLRRITALAGVAGVLTAGAVAGASRPTARLGATAATATTTAVPAPDAARVTAALPMAFEPNVGQTDARVSFLARGRNYGVYVTPDQVMLSLGTGGRRQAVRVSFAGARENARVVPEGRLPGVANYLVGNDPEKWHRDVPTYESVRYAGVYDGVDARLYGTQHSLEYDLEVAPGADPSRIRVRFEGQTAVTADEDGGLALKLGDGTLRQTKAVVYQGDGASKRPVSAKYVVRGAGEVGFEVGEYDRTKPLVIDPALVYADFLGGGVSNDAATSVALDAAGNAYVVGTTNAGDFPTTPGAYDRTFNDASYYANYGDVFVTELDATGANVIWSTYLGGSTADAARDVAVDASGAAYVVGNTSSADFPVTPGAFDQTAESQYSVNEGFLTKIAPGGGSLAYSSFVGGSYADAVESVAVDALGRATISGTTSSYDFPTTAGAFDTSFNGGTSADAFVARVAADGGSLVYSTFLGGYGEDTGTAVALDAAGDAFVAGSTWSTPDFPITAGAYQSANAGYRDAYVAELAADGASLVYATYVGGASDEIAYGLAVDAAGAAYVVGSTSSTDYPVTAGAFSTPFTYGLACFVTKIAPGGGAAAYSSRFTGASYGYAYASGVAVDASGDAFVTGATSASDFPTTVGAFDTTIGGQYDAFALELNPAGSALVYSTFLGGVSDDEAAAIAITAAQTAVVVGYALSGDFPTTPGALAQAYAGGSDGFVTKVAAGGGSLVYSTYLSGDASPGGNVADEPAAVALDASGNVYVAGTTASPNFPTTPGAFDTTPNTTSAYSYLRDAFVTKVSPDGASLVYSTFLGGDYDDAAFALALGPAGQAYVGGGTSSPSFPTTAGAFDTTYSLSGYPYGYYGEGYVAELAADGASLVYSTFVGGDGGDAVDALAVGAGGAVYATGATYSSNFPTSAGAYDAVYGGYQRSDAFAVEIAAGGGALVYGTYLGGSADDAGAGIAVDAAGAAYVVGSTTSPNYPTTPGALDATYGGYASGQGDAFVTKVAPNGTSLGYSTYLGGQYADEAADVAVDAAGAAYVTGTTASFDFPTTPGAYDPVSPDQYSSGNAFVTKLAPSGASLGYSTYLGGIGGDEGTGLALDASGVVTVVGVTNSPGFPTTLGAYDRTFNTSGYYSGTDAFMSRFDATGATLLYSTYLGGDSNDAASDVAVTAGGRAAIVGTTTARDFATTGFGGRDAASGFVAVLDPGGTPGGDSVGVYAPASGAWFLRDDNSSGPATRAFGYGAGGAGLVPLVGDWDGDGTDTPGVYQPATGTFFLKNSNGAGGADVVFQFGAGGAGVVPFAGDWDGNGTDTVGFYVTATGAFFIRNANAAGPADLVFQFGAGGAVPLAGDWDGNGYDSVGLYDPATGTFFLKDSLFEGPADYTFAFGGPSLVPIVGDWNNDGADTVGVYVPSSGAWFLRNALAGGPADVSFVYGPPNLVPLAGNWDGQ